LVPPRSIEGFQGYVDRTKTIGSNVDAFSERASVKTPIRGDDESFALPPQKYFRAVRPCAARRFPRPVEVPLDLACQGVKGIGSLRDITG
jgi:hypothetical protein